MITKYIKGDLFTATGFIAHGTNCLGVMGSGVAKIVKEKYPQAFEEYSEICDDVEYSNNLLGNIQICEEVEHVSIINMFTQDGVNSSIMNPGMAVSYDAINASFKALNDLMTHMIVEDEPRVEINIPKIGAGLGGGDWNVIETIINSVTPDVDIIVYEYE